MPLPGDIVEYCRIHAGKMSEEGWHKTAIVLDEAADEIKRLRKANAPLFDHHQDTFF